VTPLVVYAKTASESPLALFLNRIVVETRQLYSDLQDFNPVH
jgi:hypothetical protein